jgi:hypothetical protein
MTDHQKGTLMTNTTDYLKVTIKSLNKGLGPMTAEAQGTLANALEITLDEMKQHEHQLRVMLKMIDAASMRTPGSRTWAIKVRELIGD